MGNAQDTSTDTVRGHASRKATRDLDQRRLERIRQYADAPAHEVSEHLLRLDKEWDIERRLEANAAAIGLTSVLLGLTHSRRWFVLSAAVPTFLLQHAVQGWCPPIEVFRRLGARSRNEIDAERTAIKALRGDFSFIDHTAPDAAETALRAAGSR